MAKKKSRKSRTSQGIHGTTRSCGKAQGMTRLLNQLDAYIKGKNVRVTIATNRSNEALKKVSGDDLWGKAKLR